MSEYIDSWVFSLIWTTDVYVVEIGIELQSFSFSDIKKWLPL